MNETEINLIREYTHVHFLIKEAVTALEDLKKSRMSFIGMLTFATKSFGAKLKEKLRSIQKELRVTGIHVWIEDDGDEVIYACTSKNGVKGRHGIKRSVLQEDMGNTLDVLMKEFMLEDTVVKERYTIEPIHGDPYAHIK